MNSVLYVNEVVYMVNTYSDIVFGDIFFFCMCIVSVLIIVVYVFLY